MSNYIIKKYSFERADILGVKIKVSLKQNKKIDVYDKDDRFLVSIGDVKYSDYPTYIENKGIEYADERRRLYKIRNHKYINIKNTPAYYADQILW